MLPQLDSEVASSTLTPRLGTGSSIAGTPRNTQVVLSLLDVLGDKWTVLIVDLLAIGPARFSELGRQIDGISNKALSHALKTCKPTAWLIGANSSPYRQKSSIPSRRRGRR